MKKRTYWMLAAVLAAAAVMAGTFWIHGRSRVTEKQLFAMDTVISFTASGFRSGEAVDAAIAEVQRLDKLLSTGDPDSEVYQLNANGSGAISTDTAALLQAAQSVYEDTGGLFDCTIYPLKELWGFTGDDPQVPVAAAIQSLLPLVDSARIQVETIPSDGAASSQNSRTEVTLGDGQAVDFGGIAKGYTSARVMEVFRTYGVRSGMVSLGGNVQVLGKKPDGTSWRIGIRDPNGEAAYLAVLTVADRAVVTSGGYERYFEKDGKRYIHILDPRTGYPAESDLLSVTVVSPDGTLADGLSTALFVMGLEDAAEYWRTHADAFQLVLIDRENRIYITAGLEDCCESERELIVLR